MSALSAKVRLKTLGEFLQEMNFFSIKWMMSASLLVRIFVTGFGLTGNAGPPPANSGSTTRIRRTSETTTAAKASVLSDRDDFTCVHKVRRLFARHHGGRCQPDTDGSQVSSQPLQTCEGALTLLPQ